MRSLTPRILPSRFAAATVASACFALSAQAIELSQVDARKSSLAFTYTQMGVASEGQFRRFPTQLRFDPAQPANASATLEIDLASIDTGSPEANEEVASKAWFNTKAHPTARFVSSAIRPLGGERYEVAGKLTIKGITRDVTAPATFRQTGNVGVFAGAFTLKRADFSIGEGMWADFGTVANEIQVRFRITASAAAEPAKMPAKAAAKTAAR